MATELEYAAECPLEIVDGRKEGGTFVLKIPKSTTASVSRC
ncbi:MAG TPA: hypothetical protein PLZ93_04420 [Nocardioides sp.]|nr:hypothetical protein [uncultured Nocardioides sp.]HRI94833.1 hypothetical protein [Nocardioides sp.]HRK44904.1 hypothetical protein [Nocardioides sp.]